MGIESNADHPKNLLEFFPIQATDLPNPLTEHIVPSSEIFLAQQIRRDPIIASLSDEYTDYVIAYDAYQRLALDENTVLPTKITGPYRKKIKDELDILQRPGGALYNGSFPRPGFADIVEGQQQDYVGDRLNMPPGLENILMQKYEDRAVVFAEEECAGNCVFCFRGELLEKNHQNPKSLPDFNERLTQAINYVDTTNIEEIIISGGDGMINPHNIESLLTRFSTETSVKNFRIHTRSIVFLPSLFNDEIIDLLANYNVLLYFHIIHPYEIDDGVKEKIDKLDKQHVRMFYQFPLLAGVNDNVAVLEKHARQLAEINVHGANTFIADPIPNSKNFRIPLETAFTLVDDANQKLPSWARLPNLVLDTSIGKVHRGNIKSWNKKTGIVTFQRINEMTGKLETCTYQDFSKKLYNPP